MDKELKQILLRTIEPTLRAEIKEVIDALESKRKLLRPNRKERITAPVFILLVVKYFIKKNKNRLLGMGVENRKQLENMIKTMIDKFES